MSSSTRREGDHRSDFHRKLVEKRSAVDSLQIRPNVRKTIESMASQYLRYFAWSLEDGKIRTRARNNAITTSESRLENSSLCITVNICIWNAFPYTAIGIVLRRHFAR